MEQAVKDDPHVLDVLKLHYLKWLLFPIKGDTYLMYQAIFDTSFDKYTEDAVALFQKTVLTTAFENVEGWPAGWRPTPAAGVGFFRERHGPSFLEVAEYPYVSASEIKKALSLPPALSHMLDEMQYSNF